MYEWNEDTFEKNNNKEITVINLIIVLIIKYNLLAIGTII